jgi:hypothetical protein
MGFGGAYRPAPATRSDDCFDGAARAERAPAPATKRNLAEDVPYVVEIHSGDGPGCEWLHSQCCCALLG